MLSDLVNRANTGMIQGRSGTGFAPEPLQSVGVGNYFVRKKFEGNEAPKFHVLGLVHDTHPAATQLLEDPVVRDDLTNHARKHVRRDAGPSQRTLPD